MKELPLHVAPYKKTPEFTEQTVPPALLKEHHTKAGVWGVVHVVKGQLEYVITDIGAPERHLITPDISAIIAPQQKHYVTLHAGTVFYVEFHK